MSVLRAYLVAAASLVASAACASPARVPGDVNFLPYPLTDATTITVDAATSTSFTVTLGGNRTLAAPTNLLPGQDVDFQIMQDGTGGRSLTFDAAYQFPPNTPAIAQGANAISYFRCKAWTAALLECTNDAAGQNDVFARAAIGKLIYGGL